MNSSNESIVGGKVFVITGPTNAGKDTIYNYLFEDENFLKEANLHKVVRYTSRAKRENEEEGIDYYFRSNTEMEKLILSEFFIEYCEFQKYDENGNHVTTIYGTSYQSLEYGEKNYILTGSIEVLETLKEELGDRVIPIYIDAPGRHRLRRYLNRGNDDSGEEICRRFLDDLKKYNKDNLNRLGMTEDEGNIFINEDTAKDMPISSIFGSVFIIEDTIKDIKSYIISKVK